MQLIDINGRIEDIAGKIYPLNLNVEKQKYSIDLGFYFFYNLIIGIIPFSGSVFYKIFDIFAFFVMFFFFCFLLPPSTFCNFLQFL